MYSGATKSWSFSHLLWIYTFQRFFLLYLRWLEFVFVCNQVFRSIDSGSAKGFPKDMHAAAEKVLVQISPLELKHHICLLSVGLEKKLMKVTSMQNLVNEKNLLIDRSIQLAYVQAIRSAQHFIYIENQYFLGSSYAWDSSKNSGILLLCFLLLCACDLYIFIFTLLSWSGFV